MIIAGTGTRRIVETPEIMAWVVDRLSDLLQTRDGVTVISGMAEGFDEALALAAIRVGTPFHAYVPHPTYGAYYWGGHSLTGRDRLSEFEDILSRAAEIVTVCRTLYVRGVHANFVRNTAMVDAADRIWCYDRSSRGTSHAVRYAESIGRPIHFLPMYS